MLEQFRATVGPSENKKVAYLSSNGAWVRKELQTEQIMIIVQFELQDLPPAVSLLSAGIVVNCSQTVREDREEAAAA